jgi:hypothetical protein
MTILEKIEYNRKSAKDNGWSPEDFGGLDFDVELITRIGSFQRAMGLAPDGLCGTSTLRRLATEKQATKGSAIICGGKEVPIKWPKVITMGQPGAFTVKAGSIVKKPGRKPTMFIVHWDACLSSAACASVLIQRGLSVHFCIDNDGTIYQLVDCDDIAYHAKGANSCSIGVETSNAFYAKYQPWYESHGFGPRPIVARGPCNNGSVEEHLGFYPIQEQALKVLIHTVCAHYGIPLVVPVDAAGVLETKQVASVVDNSFHGVISHLHLNSQKIDCAGLKLDELIKV